jgi:hypothetical protein
LTSLTLEQMRARIGKLRSILSVTPSLVHLKLISNDRLLDGKRLELFISTNLPVLDKFEFLWTKKHLVEIDKISNKYWHHFEHRSGLNTRNGLSLVNMTFAILTYTYIQHLSVYLRYNIYQIQIKFRFPPLLRRWTMIHQWWITWIVWRCVVLKQCIPTLNKRYVIYHWIYLLLIEV